MKKSNLLVGGILIILVIALSFYFIRREKEWVDYASDINFDGRQLLAIAKLNDISEVSDKYIKNFESIKVYQMDGEELYLIIPRYKSIEVKIYSVNLENNEVKKGDLIVTVNQPFTINCNISNIMFEIKYNNRIVSYFPKLNDNNMVIINDYVLDITK